MKQFLIKHIKIALLISSLILTILLGIFIGILLVYQKGFKQIESLEDLKPNVMTIVYDESGQPFKEFADEKRLIVKSTDIPEMLKKAVVAAEDNAFYTHWGINFKGFMRAVMGVVIGKHRGGGSSITQQLARNLFLTKEFSMTRKISEMLMAIQIEKRYTKDQIMTFYLNKIWFGGTIYGVEAASRYYFGKSVKTLNTAESALLAAIIPSPSNKFSVFKMPKNTMLRRDSVLGRMLDMHLLDRKEYDAALKVKLPQRPYEINRETIADYFAEDIRKYLEQKFGRNSLFREGGLKVYTTLNRDIQQWAVEALQNGVRAVDQRHGWNSKDKLFNAKDAKKDIKTYVLPSWKESTLQIGKLNEGIVLDTDAKKATVRIADYSGDVTDFAWARKPLNKILRQGDVALFKILTIDNAKKHLTLRLEREPEVEGAMLVVDNKTGEIKAMIGGYSFEKSKFNRAIQALRQTGSTFKPIIYTAALEHGFTPTSLIDDEKFSYIDEYTGQLWEPHNHKEDFLGPLTFRRGLEKSRNIVTARILNAITPQVGYDYARRFGISSPVLKPYISMSLGSFEVTLKDMVAAFTVFPNGGIRVNPFYIKSIRDRNNNLMQEDFPERKQVLSKDTAYVMNYLLQGVVQRGTAYAARTLPAPMGGKTGTTNDFTNAWYIGYTPSVTVGIWIGYDELKPLGYEQTGAVAALPIFIEFMKKYLEKFPETGKFERPSGVIMVPIDRLTGKLFRPDCLNTYYFEEAFLLGTEPTEFCTEEAHLKIHDYYKEKENVVEE